MPKNSKKRKRAESRPTRLNMKALFKAGDGYGLSRNDVRVALDKHMSCNWGDVNDDRWAWNDEAYKSGGEAISLHKSGNGDAFMIITEIGGGEISLFRPTAQIMKRAS